MEAPIGYANTLGLDLDAFLDDLDPPKGRQSATPGPNDADTLAEVLDRLRSLQGPAQPKPRCPLAIGCIWKQCTAFGRSRQ
jgi:hypothetical protein